jgi:hypothetical protein
MDAAVFINLRACSEVYKWKKMRYQEAPSSYHSNASRTNEFEDPCKELWRKTLSVVRSEISGQISSPK